MNSGSVLKIGIQHSKNSMHAGPMGLVELTSTKFIVHGKGQVRKCSSGFKRTHFRLVGPKDNCLSRTVIGELSSAVP